jgi:TnsA endonuclease N terminal
MSLKFSRGAYKLKYPEKYVGSTAPIYRSGWEVAVMRMCDENPSIQQWASEPIKIPYRDPLTGKQSVYVPDFLVTFVDRNQRKHAELWEVKPANQQILEKVGKNPYNQAQFVKNQAKWAAASIWCRNQGIKFRILNEHDIFHNGRNT